MPLYVLARVPYCSIEREERDCVFQYYKYPCCPCTHAILYRKLRVTMIRKHKRMFSGTGSCRASAAMLLLLLLLMALSPVLATAQAHRGYRTYESFAPAHRRANSPPPCFANSHHSMDFQPPLTHKISQHRLELWPEYALQPALQRELASPAKDSQTSVIGVTAGAVAGGMGVPMPKAQAPVPENPVTFATALEHQISTLAFGPGIISQIGWIATALTGIRGLCAYCNYLGMHLEIESSVIVTSTGSLAFQPSVKFRSSRSRAPIESTSS
jgi:hypothetical protein